MWTTPKDRSPSEMWTATIADQTNKETFDVRQRRPRAAALDKSLRRNWQVSDAKFKPILADSGGGAAPPKVDAPHDTGERG